MFDWSRLNARITEISSTSVVIGRVNHFLIQLNIFPHYAIHSFLSFRLSFIIYRFGFFHSFVQILFDFRSIQLIWLLLLLFLLYDCPLCLVSVHLFSFQLKFHTKLISSIFFVGHFTYYTSIQFNVCLRFFFFLFHLLHFIPIRNSIMFFSWHCSKMYDLRFIKPDAIWRSENNNACSSVSSTVRFCSHALCLHIY